jgi:hypothetical protein
MNRELIRLGYAKGRSTKDGQHYIGNISFHQRNPGDKIKPRLIVVDEMLVPDGTGGTDGVVPKAG